jgi:translation initiation factor 2 subunit 3
MEKIETINIGIVGHIDHGKTTLLQRLSGVWASRHSEELKRGITIKLGYADTVIYEDKGKFNVEKKGKPVRHVSFVDAPGHEMLMATMLSGAAMIDGAVLVIAANEGVKPQTREHLMALKAKGVKSLMVVQNKIDLVDKGEAEKNHKEIRELLGKEYEKVPVIPVSAQQGVNIDMVLEYLAGICVPERDLKSEPVFVVARSFDINKPGKKPEELCGAVLGGTLKKGILREGDEIEIKPGRRVKGQSGFRFEPIVTKINGLFVGSEKVKEITPGGSMSIETVLDMALGKGDGLGGNLVSLKGKLPEPSNKIRLKFELFDEVYGLTGHVKVEDVRKSETLMLSVNTSTTGGTVGNVKGGMVEVDLKVPAVVFSGDCVGVARNMGGHWRLIGWGEVQ